MTKDEIKKILEQRLTFLSRIDWSDDITDICNVTEEMINLSTYLLSLDQHSA